MSTFIFSGVKDKRLKLMRNDKKKEELTAFLQDHFRVPEKTSIIKKRKIQSELAAPDTPSPEEKRRRGLEEGVHNSLVDDCRNLQLENTDLKSEISGLKQTIAELTSAANTSSANTGTIINRSRVDRPSQKISRLENTADLWRGKYFALKDKYNVAQRSLSEVDRLKSDLRKVRSLHSSMLHYYKTKLGDLNDKLAIKDNHKSCLKAQRELHSKVLYPENELLLRDTEENVKVIPTKDGCRYNTAVRKSIYHAFQHQCPVDHAANVIQYAAEQFTGATFEAVPCPATVSKMSKELGQIADIQAGEALLSSENCTIAYGATKLSGSHFNEIHIATGPTAPVPQYVDDFTMPIATENTHESREYFTLGVAQLPGGTAADYVDHINQGLQQTADTYDGWTGQDSTEVLNKIKRNITNTISDRAAVNHCVAEQLKDTVNPAMLELNCNVHPLDLL